MKNEIFRFMVVRPAQARSKYSKSFSTIEAYGDSNSSSLFREISESSTTVEAQKKAKKFLADPSKVVDSSRSVTAFIKELDLRLEAQKLNDPQKIREIISTLTKGMGITDWTTSLIQNELGVIKSQLFDILLASIISGDSEVTKGTRLIRWIRMVELVMRVAENNALTQRDVSRLLRARPILPRFNVPRPEDTSTSKTLPTVLIEPDGKHSNVDKLEALRATKNELEALSQENAEFRPQDLTSRESKFRLFAPRASKQPAVPKIPWRERLSAEATAALMDMGPKGARSSLQETINVLEESISGLSRIQPLNIDNGNSYKLGNQIHSSNTDQPGSSMIFYERKIDPLEALPTVPKGMGEASVRRRGDLMIVRQKLKHYELGEIAHIENVLKGEAHERTFSRSQTSEETFMRSQESSTSEERDLQSTERFELSSEVKETVKDDLKLEAGLTLSASYGPTVGIEASTSFAFEHAQEKSKNTASNYARELTNRAQTRVETRVAEQRISRVIHEVRELSRHAIDNSSSPSGHVRGVYRWVNKIYEAQLVNYGIRDLYSFYLPEPAAFWRFTQAGIPVKGVTLSRPSPPKIYDGKSMRMLQPSDLTPGNYHKFVALYGAQDVTPPPKKRIRVSAILKGADQGKASNYAGTTVSSELVIPDGYVSEAMRFNGTGLGRTGEGYWWDLLVGGLYFAGFNSEMGELYGPNPDNPNELMRIDTDRGRTITFGGRVGIVPIALVHDDYFTVGVSVEMRCLRTEAAFEAWQLATYTSILQGYQRQKSAYDEQVNAARESEGIVIQGKNPAFNEKVIKDEVKRCALSIITGQRFEMFDAMRSSAGTNKYPEIAFPDAMAEGRYVAFFEQAFEWENMTFVFYPYFWGKKEGWPLISQLDDTDYLFAQFLRAGFARAQVPVRPGFESLVEYTLAPENWNGDIWIGEEPPGFERDGSLPIEDELLLQTGGTNAVMGPGFVSFTNGSDVVNGTNTDFSSDDLNRELVVGDKSYRIIEIRSATEVRIAAPFPTTSITNSQYALGPKLVGLPWEITLPTTLVYLQEDDKINPS